MITIEQSQDNINIFSQKRN